ncbi:uncharacterized protein LOC124642458 isoform X2 [Helicoverpa zea]|uniref:uncharacterized protein LOC124642458 isoform X2 n=1 Tax=Helicoverpa zea TaxID=7113 RepID=UPI001F5A1359|nr:uncharacterized protein LOC124642458 isoform X2 [Helicoverpa zea]
MALSDELAQLKLRRGYVKGAITREESFCNSEEIVIASSELLTERRSRLVKNFASYEDLNKSILCINPKDDEDPVVYESKYFTCISKIDRQLNACRTSGQPEAEPPRQNANNFRKLPQITIKEFSGANILDYLPFINMFKAVIDSDTSLSLCQKLYYLRSFLTGEALCLIQNLPLTEVNYSEALKLLENRYNNEPMIINHHINTLIDLPKCTAADLRSLVASANVHLTALKSLNMPVEAWGPIMVNILLRKVDSETNNEFHLRRDKKVVFSMQEFIDFLESRALARENAMETMPVSTPSGVKPGKPACNTAAAVSCASEGITASNAARSLPG